MPQELCLKLCLANYLQITCIDNTFLIERGTVIKMFVFIKLTYNAIPINISLVWVDEVI